MGIYKVVYQNYEEGDTLFYNNINPYDRTMPLLFYKPKGLVIKQFNDTTYGKFDCAILKHQGSVQVTKLAYCNIPVFILNAQSKLKMSKLRPYKLYISR